MSISEINAVSSDVYGAGILAIDPTGALWVAERILETTGKNVFLKISRYRNARGKGTTFPAFGCPLFSGI